jgi:hypothetical protein
MVWYWMSYLVLWNISGIIILSTLLVWFILTVSEISIHWYLGFLKLCSLIEVAFCLKIFHLIPRSFFLNVFINRPCSLLLLLLKWRFKIMIPILLHWLLMLIQKSIFRCYYRLLNLLILLYEKILFLIILMLILIQIPLISILFLLDLFQVFNHQHLCVFNYCLIPFSISTLIKPFLIQFISRAYLMFHSLWLLHLQ